MKEKSIPSTRHHFKYQSESMTTKQPDWEAIARAYRAGVLSDRLLNIRP